MSEIEKQCLSLSRGERERLAKILMESLEDTKMSLDEIHDVVVKVIGFEFIMPGRDIHQSVGRTIFSYFAYIEGYSEYKIGEYLHRDHSTVHYMKERMKDWLFMPNYYKQEYNWYEQVKKELYETN